MKDSEPPRYKSSPEDLLNAAVIEVLGKDNPHAYSTILFIQRSLRQFNLTTQYEAYEIINDAYVRGRTLLHSGGTIRNIHSWLKSTSFNIIRENSRRQIREPLIDPEIAELLPCLQSIENSILSQEEVNYKWNALMNSLFILTDTDPEGARLLCFKAQGMSWKEIHQQLVKEDGEAPSESTLRQKGCRATKTLRKLYHLETNDDAKLEILG